MITTQLPARCGTTQAFWRYKLSDMPTRSGTPRARNRYDAICRTCGRAVRAGDGCVAKSSTGAWVVYC